MKKLCVALILLVLLVSFSHVYADEPKENEEKKTDEIANDVEKQVKEILDPENKDLTFKDRIKKLKAIGEPAIPYLIESINNWISPAEASFVLQRICSKKHLPELFNAYVTNDRSSIKFKFACAIERIGSDSITFLCGKLDEKDDDIRFDIVHLIVFCDAENALEALKKHYKKESSDLIKLHIIGRIYHLDKESNEEYLDYVHKMIKDPDENVRIEAIQTTGRIKDETQIDLLISYLEDDSKLVVQRVTIATLVSYEKEKTIDVVLKLIKKENITIGKTAIFALTLHRYSNNDIKKKVVKALVDELANENEEIRYYLVLNISFLADLSMIPHLEKIAEKDPVEKIRVRARESIERVKKEAEFQNQYEDSNEESSDESKAPDEDKGNTLEKQVREILDNEAKEKIDVLVRRIKEIGESAVPYLIKEINSGEKVFVAVRALNEIRGVACIPDLFKAFVTRTKIVDGRFYLASTIRLHKKPALKFLFEKLNDEDEIVRMNAVELIAYCELLNSIDELKELYAKDKSNLVKLQIIREIFKVDDRSQKDYLEYTHEMLNNANEDVKIKAIDVTQWIKDETQIDLIITFLDDKSFEVRKSAIKGLLSFGNEKAINAVIKTIKHEDSETGKYTITWLSIQYIIADQKVKKRVIETFIDELANENIVIRLEIVKRLSTFRDSSIIPHLEKIAENDPEEEIRVEAKKSIERINRNIKANEDMKNFGNKDENKKDDEEGMDPIEKQVNEILSKYNIDLTDRDKIKKLVEIGEPAVQYLLPKLESKDQNQQYLAASALKEICGTKCLSHLVDAYLKQERQNFKLKKVITSFGVDAFNQLQARFNDEDEMIRAEIVSLLISIDFRKAENVLRMQFNIEKSDRVKLYIAMYYQGSDKENKELYQQFIYEMLRGQDEDLKWLAINHVGRKRDFTAFAQLVVLTSDESSKVRIAALRAISQNHCEETVDAILKALKHEDEDTRMEAASCLSLYNFKDKELELKAIKALIEALNDEDHSVRNRVIRALSVHDDMIIVPALEKVAQDDTIKANREYAERAIKQIKLRNGIKDDIDDD